MEIKLIEEVERENIIQYKKIKVINYAIMEHRTRCQWYLDFLKDSYSTGIVFDKPSDKFLELYKNWDNYVKQYKLDRFYNVDKKFFLNDLTNFMYTYFEKYDGIGKAKKWNKVLKI